MDPRCLPAHWNGPGLSGRPLGWVGLALFLAGFASPSLAGALPDDPPHRFLMIYSDHAALPAYQQANAGAEAVFRAALDDDFELYPAYRDGQRFPGSGWDSRFAEEMRGKYADKRFDAVLVFGRAALFYALAHHAEFAGRPPVVFGGAPEGAVAAESLPQEFHGIATAYSIAGTLDLARRLQPGAERVVFMAGSSPFDLSWRPQAEAAVAGTGLAAEFVTGLTLDGFRDRAAALDPATILIVLTIFQDAAGESFVPVRAAARIAEVSAAPPYTVHPTYLGNGFVGGAVESFGEIGGDMARLALRLGKGATSAPPLSKAVARPTVDWRQLAHFGLDPDLLPPRTVLLFHKVSPWREYRLQILLALAIVVAQSFTIGALFLQSRRRRLMEVEVAQRRSELAHAARVTQMGELSGALAHELNQPLTSILANAEAGMQLLGREHPDLEEIAAILEDIADDDRRAAGIIRDLRQLMSKGQAECTLLDLNEVMMTTLGLLGSELVARRVVV